MRENKKNIILVQVNNTANQCIVMHLYIPFCGNPTTYIIGCLLLMLGIYEILDDDYPNWHSHNLQ